jgi:hypothetical protein
MKRREFITLIAGAAAAWPLAARAQQPGKVQRVGFLWDSPAVWPHALAGFRGGLRDLGWVEGQNVVVEYRWAEGRFDRLPAMVEELVRLKVDVIVAPTSIYTAAAGAFTAMVQERAGGVVVLSTPLFMGAAMPLAELAIKHKLPTMFGPREHVEAGGLLSYSPDRADLYRRAATYVDKILRGTTPADLPVQQPTKFEFIVNLKTAKAIGLTIPPTLLARADEVIE